MEWYLKVLKNFADFKGRARRQEYWMFVLFNVLISFGLSAIDLALNINFLSLIYTLIVIVPSIAVAVRRLHDIGKSGINFLFVLIPIVGAIILLLWLIKEGGKNGNDQKGLAMDMGKETMESCRRSDFGFGSSHRMEDLGCKARVN